MKAFVPDFNLISSEPTTFAGKPAQKIVFEVPNLYGLEIKGLSIMTVDGTVGYSLSFFAEKSSFDSYLPQVNTTIDSFTISEQSNESVEIEQFPLSQYLTYEDPQKGLSIKYPPNWQNYEFVSSENDAIFQSPLESSSDVFRENSLIKITKITGTSLEDYSSLSINSFDSRSGLTGTPQDSPTILGGFPAHQILFTEKEERGIEVTGWIVWTVVNDFAYNIAFVSTSEEFDSYKPIFQNMIDSVKIEKLNLPTPISGAYSNPEVGLEIQLPDGWEGIEQQKEDVTMVVVSPGITIQPFSQGSQMSDKLEFSLISIIMGKYSAIKEEISSNISEDVECSSQTVQVIELNSMKTQESDADCQDPVMGTIKGLEYMFATKDNAIVVSYGAISKNPDKKFDENIEQFKESLNTLKIQNTLDLSDPFAYEKTLGMTSSKETVTIDGKNLDILVTSNSNISNVSFDEQTNSITFEQKGQDGVDGMTEVYLGEVLEEPYSVTMGNHQIDDFVVVHDTTNGQTSIFFESEEPSGLVTITNQLKGTEIPDWVRGNAQWWAQGAIGDSDFVSGIQYLIKEGIMTIPETAKGESSEAKEIPSWIKNNADWWAQGLISDNDFVKGIQFLIENGIMEI